MRTPRKNVRYPENLEVKAKLIISGREITEVADAIGVSRNWLNQVLNGHQKGTETIESVNQELQKQVA